MFTYYYRLEPDPAAVEGAAVPAALTAGDGDRCYPLLGQFVAVAGIQPCDAELIGNDRRRLTAAIAMQATNELEPMVIAKWVAGLCGAVVPWISRDPCNGGDDPAIRRESPTTMGAFAFPRRWRGGALQAGRYCWGAQARRVRRQVFWSPAWLVASPSARRYSRSLEIYCCAEAGRRC